MLCICKADRLTDKEVVCTVQLLCLPGGTLKATGVLHQAVSAWCYSSTVLFPISPAAFRHLVLCKDVVEGLVIPRPNFLGHALLTSVTATEEEFCRAESRNKLFSFSHQDLSDIKPSCSCWVENPWEDFAWGFFLPGRVVIMWFLEGVSSAYSVKIGNCLV